MSTSFGSQLLSGVLLSFGISCAALAQANPRETDHASPISQTMRADMEQTAEILGLAAPIAKLRTIQSQAPCNSSMSPEEVSLRQELSEMIQTSTLEVDGVLSEINNERNELGDLRTVLQSKRDHTVAVFNSAALITGAGVGAFVSGTQFTTNSSTLQNAGDGIGIGAGVVSTILSFAAVRKQNGPKASVGEVPNMLAPLFEKTEVLQTHYPPAVFQYLHSVPPGQEDRGTRFEQLRNRWAKTGRLSTSTPVKESQSIVTASTSMDRSVKVSINDLTNRIAMLADVSGRVSLIKRDLGELMRLYTGRDQQCSRQ